MEGLMTAHFLGSPLLAQLNASQWNFLTVWQWITGVLVVSEWEMTQECLQDGAG